ncbi:MAG: hypothetical protein OXL38_02035 [Gammaproteobacteria bacterium]|nr:hypothetical protein [Gammaproteobacteria bacterium]
MKAPVIDTLRFANRLKEAGFTPGQAEAMSGAFNDEFAQGMATKQDLGNAVTELKGQIATEVARVDAKVDAMDAKFEGSFRAVNSRFDAMEVRFDAMDGKFGALSAQFAAHSRYVFLVLALVAGLGLYNAVAPHFAATAATGPVGKQPATTAPAQASRGSHRADRPSSGA